MRPTLLWALMLLVSPFALAQGSPPAPAKINASDEAQINGIFKRWEIAWNTHDPVGWAQLFHEDGTWVLWTGGVWKGRAAIANGLREPFRTVYSNSIQLWQSRPEIRLVAPDVAVARSLSATTGDSRQPGVTIYGNKMLVLTKRNGIWGVLYGQNTRLNEAEVARLLTDKPRSAPAATERSCALDLVGTWQLVSIANWGPDGKRNAAPFGKKPSGMFIFSADGHTSVIISYDNRKRLSSDDRLAGSIEEKANAFDTSFGYSGRYTCSGDRVIVRVTHATVPNWVGTDMVRMIKLVGGRLSISTPPFVVGGTSSAWELVWERPR